MSLAAAYVNSQRIGISLLCVALSMASTAQGESVARSWNEANLDAIRSDFPHPAVHARNLFHVSVAMWDAWAAYDETAVGYVHNESAIWTNIPQARDVAVSYAGYRVLAHRYALSVSSTQTLDTIAALMGDAGLRHQRYDHAWQFSGCRGKSHGSRHSFFCSIRWIAGDQQLRRRIVHPDE